MAAPLLSTAPFPSPSSEPCICLANLLKLQQRRSHHLASAQVLFQHTAQQQEPPSAAQKRRARGQMSPNPGSPFPPFPPFPRCQEPFVFARLSILIFQPLGNVRICRALLSHHSLTFTFILFFPAILHSHSLGSPPSPPLSDYQEAFFGRRTPHMFAAFAVPSWIPQLLPFPPFSDYQEAFSGRLTLDTFAAFFVPSWIPQPPQLLRFAKVVYPYWKKRRVEQGSHQIIPVLNVSLINSRSPCFAYASPP
jgi:hypothetical protein